MRAISGMIMLIFLHNISCVGQSWELSLKAGAATDIAAPASSGGFAYKTIRSNTIRPSLAIQVSKYKPESSFGFFCGLALQPVTNSFAFNERNINLTSSYGGTLAGGENVIQLYGGIEKGFQNLKSPNYKNYFSAVLGLGLNYYYFRPSIPNAGIKINHQAMTKAGEQIVGSMFGEDRYIVGAPSVFTGLRYNITDSKGKVVVILESAINIGLIKYFDHRITYQINGIERQEFLPERGWNIQFNIIIPITRFKKTKNRTNEKK